MGFSGSWLCTVKNLSCVQLLRGTRASCMDSTSRRRLGWIDWLCWSEAAPSSSISIWCCGLGRLSTLIVSTYESSGMMLCASLTVRRFAGALGRGDAR